MKKLLLIILSLLFLFPASPVLAVTPTPTPAKVSPSAAVKEGISKKLDEQINELKEKIASRVSELNLVEKRGMIGVVTDISGNKITIKDVADNVRFVDVDEITKFSSASNKSFGLSDIKKGVRLNVLGLYNKQSKRILARFVSTTVDPTFVSGSISDLDKTNFFITVITPDQKQIRIDVQTSTKISSYDKTNDLTKIGFSKLSIGDRITVIGYADKKIVNQIVGDRVIDFLDLPKNPKIKISQPQPSETPTPTPSSKTKSKISTP